MNFKICVCEISISDFLLKEATNWICLVVNWLFTFYHDNKFKFIFGILLIIMLYFVLFDTHSKKKHVIKRSKSNTFFY